MQNQKINYDNLLTVVKTMKNISLKEGVSLRDRADEVLISIAVLGLQASFVDGETDSREITTFIDSFKNRFSLSTSHSNRLIEIALNRMQSEERENCITSACETLNEYLDVSQKIELLELLGEIVLADGVFNESEQSYLGYLALKLNIVKNLFVEH